LWLLMQAGKSKCLLCLLRPVDAGGRCDEILYSDDDDGDVMMVVVVTVVKVIFSREQFTVSFRYVYIQHKQFAKFVPRISHLGVGDVNSYDIIHVVSLHISYLKYLKQIPYSCHFNRR